MQRDRISSIDGTWVLALEVNIGERIEAGSATDEKERQVLLILLLPLLLVVVDSLPLPCLLRFLNVLVIAVIVGLQVVANKVLNGFTVWGLRRQSIIKSINL